MMPAMDILKDVFASNISDKEVHFLVDSFSAYIQIEVMHNLP
jgi:hypothetical protein